MRQVTVCSLQYVRCQQFVSQRCRQGSYIYNLCSVRIFESRAHFEAAPFQTHTRMAAAGDISRGNWAHSLTLDGKGESVPALSCWPRVGVRSQPYWAGQWQVITVQKDFERRESKWSWHISENVCSFADDSCCTGWGLRRELRSKLNRLSGGRSGVQISAGSGDFFLIQNIRTGSPAFHSVGTGDLRRG